MRRGSSKNLSVKGFHRSLWNICLHILFLLGCKKSSCSIFRYSGRVTEQRLFILANRWWWRCRRITDNNDSLLDTQTRWMHYVLKVLSVSLQLRVQNRRRKWNFPLNFQNCIIWTSPFLLDIRNAINWGGAFSKAFRSSEALISVLSKNACLYDNI